MIEQPDSWSKLLSAENPILKNLSRAAITALYWVTLESMNVYTNVKTEHLIRENLFKEGFIWPRSETIEFSAMIGEPEGDLLFCVKPEDTAKAPQFGTLAEMIIQTTGTDQQIIPVVDQYGIPWRSATMEQVESSII